MPLVFAAKAKANAKQAEECMHERGHAMPELLAKMQLQYVGVRTSIT